MQLLIQLNGETVVEPVNFKNCPDNSNGDSSVMTKQITVTDAVMSLNSNAKVSIIDIRDIDNAQFDWLEGTTPIAREDIKAEMERLQAIEDAK